MAHKDPDGPEQLPLSCRYCGGDPTEPDHDQRCDGKQGGKDEPPPHEPPPDDDVVRIRKHRETSAQAFYNSVDAGIIETRRAFVWAALREMGKSTNNEVAAYLKARHHIGLKFDANICARLTELRDLGLIREAGERQCRISEQVCILWEAVPSSEYVGPAKVHRCPTCNQTTYREIPRGPSSSQGAGPIPGAGAPDDNQGGADAERRP